MEPVLKYRIRTHHESYETAEKRAAVAAMTAAERQARIDGMLIRYPGFTETFDGLRRIHMPVKGGTHGRGEVHGILGRSRAGKSEAVKQYVTTLGEIVTNEFRVPRALYVLAGKKMNSAMLATQVHVGLGLKSRRRMSAQSLYSMCLDEFVDKGVEMLVIDDAQFALINTDVRSQAENAAFITQLAERDCCNVVLVGPRELETAVRRDDLMYNRGSFPTVPVESYDWGSKEGRLLFRRLLSSIDVHMPFERLSGFADPTIAAHFWAVSHGRIGIVLNYAKDAARRALDADAGSVGIEFLKAAGRSRRQIDNPYVPFSSEIDPKTITDLVSASDVESLAAADEVEDEKVARAMLTKG